MQPNLDKYLKALSRLKRGNTPLGIAQHKPVLLISLIELIEKGLVTQNKIYINADLVGTFKENWQLLVNTLHQADFTQPFYYLQSDNVAGQPIWFLIPNAGCQINAHIKSVTTLAATVAYGSFSTELFMLLTDSFSGNVIKETLLQTYFPHTRQNLTGVQKEEGYIHQIEHYVLNEPEAQYKRIKIETEEDIFVRGGLFKKLVPKAYAATCSFTGMQLTSAYGHNFIDACHIVPFSLTHDDKINNGIALCPNMHRAFDRGLLSIDQDYRIIVSSGIIENGQHIYSINSRKASTFIYPLQCSITLHRKT